MSDAHHEEIAKLEALYDEHPEGRIFTHLAEAYRKDGQLDRAHEVLRDGIGRHPDYSSAHVVLGRVLLDQGRSADAAAEFRRVLDLDPQNLVATRSLGDIAHAGGDHDMALEYYQRLLAQDPNSEVKDIVEDLTGGDAAMAGAATEEPRQGSTPDSDDEWEADDWGFDGIGPVDELSESADAGQWGGLEGAEETDDDWPSDTWTGDAVELDEDAAAAAGSDQDPAAGESPVWEEAELAEEPAVEDTMDGGWPIRGEAADPGPEDGPAEAEDEEDEEPYSAPITGNEQEVRTETIAWIYARQGLYERAAEVYRDLLQSRPDDEDLKERLAEMEEAARAQRAGSSQGARAVDDPIGAPGPGDEVEAEFAAPPMDEPAPPVEEPAAPVDEPAAPVDEPVAPVEDTAVSTEADFVAPAGGGPVAPVAEEPAAAAADDSPPIRRYFEDLLGWPAESSEGADAAAAGSAPLPSGTVGTDDAWRGEVEPESGPDGSTVTEPEAGPEAGADAGPQSRSDDDDLEMFRSWLESLKQ